MSYVKKEPRRPIHLRCFPPGWWRRWRDDVGIGSVWRCDVCGCRWIYQIIGGEPGWSFDGAGMKPPPSPMIGSAAYSNAAAVDGDVDAPTPRAAERPFCGTR